MSGDKNITLNVPFQTPIANHHFGFTFMEGDFKGRIHPGVDLNGPGVGAADDGMPVKPIGPGEVTFADMGMNGGFGGLVYTKHDMVQYFASFGLQKPDWCPDFVWGQYAHLKDVTVVVGQRVGTDTIVGHLGGTPYTSKGSYTWSPHVHHEVRKAPLGVFFYPSKKTTKEWVQDHYFDPIKFVMEVNNYVAEHNDPTPTGRLVRDEARSEVYVFNRKTKFHIPDEETAILLFGADWQEEVEVVKKGVLSNYPEGDSIPSMKV